MPKLGAVMPPEWREKISRAHKGKKKPWAKSPTKGRKLPKEWVRNAANARRGQKRSIETRLRQSIAQRGEKGSGWKGGLSNKNKAIRNSLEYRLWRETVFKRDNYTCVWCGVRGGKLQADHIRPFAYYPELRFAIDNGRTLCFDCHKKTDTYLRHSK